MMIWSKVTIKHMHLGCPFLLCRYCETTSRSVILWWLPNYHAVRLIFLNFDTCTYYVHWKKYVFAPHPDVRSWVDFEFEIDFVSNQYEMIPYKTTHNWTVNARYNISQNGCSRGIAVDVVLMSKSIATSTGRTISMQLKYEIMRQVHIRFIWTSIQQMYSNRRSRVWLDILSD